MILKDGAYRHLVSNENGLFVDGELVCKNPSMFIRYLFEKYILENKTTR